MNRRRLLGTAMGLPLAMAVRKANAGLFRGRGGVTSGGGGAVEVTTFNILNTVAATSLGYKRIGLVFPDTAVPTGQRLKLERGGSPIAAQFDQINRWPSGAIRCCTCCLRDTDFTSSESRTYSVLKETGAHDNTSSLSLATTLSGTDYKVDFTSIVGSTSGAMSDLTASLNTHSGVATRVTKYESGPICDSWEIWGMAGADAHLKTVWYITAQKDAGGSVVAREIAAVPSLDWWSIAGKEKLTYTAALKDGATTIETYTSVPHVYMAQWATVRKTADDQHGARHWRGATRPTLLYKPNRTYWTSSGLVPPIDLSLSYVMPAYTNTYVPGSSHDHRAFIDGTGAYMGRGIMPNTDSIAFATQSAADVRMARVNGLVALHVPYHRRSNNTRTRPTESADTANTVVSLKLEDERGASTPGSYYDFTATGMPAAVHAYAGSATTAPYQDGYVTPGGGTVSGSTTWITSGDATHAVNYGYFMYLLEGERYLMQATLDLSVNLPQQQHGDEYGGRSWIASTGVYSGVPTTQWGGTCLTRMINCRHNGWAANCLSAAAAIVPDDDVQSGYIRFLCDHNFDYVIAYMSYFPASVNGIYSPHGQGLSPWMENIIALGAWTAFNRTGDADARTMAEFISEVAVGLSTTLTGMIRSYRFIARPSSANWNASTNDWYASTNFFDLMQSISIDSATNRLTVNAPLSLTYTTDDRFVIFDMDEGTSVAGIAVPSELTLGTVYWIVSPTAGTSFQISLTQGGAAIDFTSSYTGKAGGVRLANAAAVPPVYVSQPDDFGPICRAVLIEGRRNGFAPTSQALIDAVTTYLADTDSTAWANWNYDEAA